MATDTLYTKEDVCQSLGIEEARLRYYEAILARILDKSFAFFHEQHDKRIHENTYERIVTVHQLVSKGCTPYQIQKAILKKEEREDKKVRLARVMAFASGKGGVGKTTAVTNIGASLSQLGHRVLCIDGDLGLGNLHIMMGVNPSFSLEHCVNQEFALRDIIEEGPQGVHLIAAAKGSYQLANLSQKDMIVLVNSIQEIKDQYDYILIDCSAGIAGDVYEWVSFAHGVTVVVTPSIVSLADSYSFIKILEEKSQDQKIHVVVNSCRDRAEADFVYKKIKDSCQLALKKDVEYLGFVLRDRQIEESVQRRTPFVLEASGISPSCGCFKRIAQRIVSGKSDLVPGEYAAQSSPVVQKAGSFSKEEKLVSLYLGG